MMKKEKETSNRIRAANWFCGSFLIAGAILRTIGGLGGPDAFYWLGNLSFAIFFTIPGFSMVIFPSFSVKCIQASNWIRGIRLSDWERLPVMGKLALCAWGLMFFMIGMAILLTNLFRMTQGCTPDGDCPGL